MIKHTFFPNLLKGMSHYLKLYIRSLFFQVLSATHETLLVAYTLSFFSLFLACFCTSFPSMKIFEKLSPPRK